ncbi:hypothetical protein BMS3Abin10_00326 [bacterium BMS3Abin10]|nr:hypothetical protein BMS3Abin10_00326 [bacterium BMS3Abin10]GBE40125.1 hypothetical protein BMS3Bbin08_02763 [bacterium BMS3Bbin08]
MRIVAVGIIIFGVILVIKPTPFARILERFYKHYPLVRLAPENKLKSRDGFIIAFGITLIVVGILAAVL